MKVELQDDAKRRKDREYTDFNSVLDVINVGRMGILLENVHRQLNVPEILLRNY